jgi:death-on-curing protein
MIYLALDEVIQLHEQLILLSGGSSGILDRGLIESALYQPQATFGGHDLCPTLEEKAAVLAFSLALNHAFVDGNKRIAHAAMETFLVRNGHEIRANVDEQETIFLRLAAGALTREEFTDWVRRHTVPLGG